MYDTIRSRRKGLEAMRRKPIYAIVSVLISLGFLTAMTDEASAIAAWGRKYSVSCSACHRAQWDLNKDGTDFLRRGHRYEQEKAGPNVSDHLSFSTKLRAKYDVQVLAIHNQAAEHMELVPDPSARIPLQASLVILGRLSDIDRLKAEK